MTARFTLSAFGDEIADDVDEQLRVLNGLDIGHLGLCVPPLMIQGRIEGI